MNSLSGCVCPANRITAGSSLQPYVRSSVYSSMMRAPGSRVTISSRSFGRSQVTSPEFMTVATAPERNLSV